MVVLPLQSDELRFVKILELDGEEFKFYIDWNSREGFYYLTVKRLDNTTIRGLVGIKIVMNCILNQFVVEDNFPNGALFAINENDEDPNLDNLKLIFASEDELNG